MKDISSLTKALVQKERNKGENIQIPTRNNFKFLYVIGKGGFGRVWKVQSKKTKEIFALKEMSKLKIIDKKSEKSINSERLFLTKLHHPFIINMHFAFQDSDNLYLVMDMLSGGDLRYHITKYKRFSEEQTRFFIANMIHALRYIHDNNVIHRDIKPENLVMDDKGYIRVTDFGIAKENNGNNSSESSGTPGYMAPEIIRGRNHSFAVDFFAVGIIGYEFMLGRRPYNGNDRKQIKDQMLNKAAFISPEHIAQGWSQDSADFINQLLQRKESRRLGFKKGALELINHPWLKFYPWSALEEKRLAAPFIPDNKDNFDKIYCDNVDRIGEETKMRYEEILCGETLCNAFEDFYYNEEEEKRMGKDVKSNKGNKETKDSNEKVENNNENNNINIVNNNKNDKNVFDNNKNCIANDRNINSSAKDDIDVILLKKAEDSLEAILNDDNEGSNDKKSEQKEKNKIINDLTLDKSEDIKLGNISSSKLMIEENIDNNDNTLRENREKFINNKLPNEKAPLTNRNHIQNLSNFDSKTASLSQKMPLKNSTNSRKNILNNTNSPIYNQISPNLLNFNVKFKSKFPESKEKSTLKQTKNLINSISTKDLLKNALNNNEKYNKINPKPPQFLRAQQKPQKSTQKAPQKSSKTNKDLIKNLSKFSHLKQPAGFPMSKMNHKNNNSINKSNININNFYTNNIFLQIRKDFVPFQNGKINKIKSCCQGKIRGDNKEIRASSVKVKRENWRGGENRRIVSGRSCGKNK